MKSKDPKIPSYCVGFITAVSFLILGLVFLPLCRQKTNQLARLLFSFHQNVLLGIKESQILFGKSTLFCCFNITVSFYVYGQQ